MNCLLCTKPLDAMPTWQQLIGIDKQTAACASCLAQFERIDAEASDEWLDRVQSLYAYNEAGKQYIHQLKFLQDIALCTIFAGQLNKLLKQPRKVIVPIPMHEENEKKRTFSQVHALLDAAHIRYENALVKTTESVMGEKNRAERLAMTEIFSVSSDIVVEGRHFMLVDDIYTTGTTLRHAARTLKERGAETVEAVTLFRPMREK